MEETSATLPLGVACTTNLHSVPALSESVHGLELSDANSFSEINSAMPPFDEFSTPKKRQCFSLDGSLYKPLCDDALKPTVGMTFDDIAVVETFYKKYAHHVGFGVRLGAQRLVNNVIQWKRFLCSREGYRSTKDATSRKNYKHFHDVLSFDSTYSTNQYDYIFAPFTGINHHMQSVFLGGGFLLNETTEDYLWLFDIFLKCMDGVAPSVIITDECGSMRNAIKALLPHTTHRLCMWHIMKKVPEKVSLELRSDELFYKRLDSCVWNSETPTEFEESWKSLISDFGLQENEWFAKCYLIRGSWVPAYFMDIALAGILRTTSRSESENSFFKNFIRRKLAFVEFWLRFDTALKCQRQEELIADHTSVHTTPRLQTCWEVERQGSILFTHEVFALFQSEVLAAREHCDVQDTMTVGELKIVSISDQSHRKNKVRDVHLETTTMIAKCSCKLFESKGIVCRHVIRVLRGAKINELPTFYVLKRWEKMCKRDIVFDNEGNALEDNPIDCIDMDTRRKISMARNKLEDIIRCAKKSSVALDSLNMGLCNLESVVLQSASVVPQTTQEEQESYVGSTMPVQVDILTPTAVNARGTCSRIKGHRDNEKKAGSNKKKLGVTLRVPRTCRTCKEVVLHDSRICPKKK